MTRFWFKMDNAFTEHRKFIDVGPSAAYLHIAAIAWCSRNKTDGLIPRGQVERLVNWNGVSRYNPAQETEDYVSAYRVYPDDLAQELVEVGLWEPITDGFAVHDYLDWQPSAEELERLHEELSQMGRRGGIASGIARRTKPNRSQIEANVEAKPKPIAKPNRSQGPSQTEADVKDLKALKALKPLKDLKALKPLVDENFVDPPEPSPVKQVFDVWTTATDRQPGRTKLNPDRRRLIAKALASHGLEDCLAAVTNIGRDAWARGENDRGTRFDDLKHALGSTERLERWRDWRAAPAKHDPDKTRRERRARRAAALRAVLQEERSQQREGIENDLD